MPVKVISNSRCVSYLLDPIVIPLVQPPGPELGVVTVAIPGASLLAQIVIMGVPVMTLVDSVHWLPLILVVNYGNIVWNT